MMDISTAYERIKQCGIMAGLRGAFPPDVALPVCEKLFTGGITVFEFLYNSERAVEAMVAVKEAYGDMACVGMGTVLSVDVAERVIGEGADFVVSPCFQPDVVEYVNKAGVLMGPGCLTPSEIAAAWAMDVRLIKLFPVGALGAEYLKQLRGPFNHINFMCNGGTHDGNVGEFIREGAVACGLGPWLTGDGTMPLETISQRARSLRHIVDAARVT